MATEWLPVDEDTLTRLAYMVELAARDQANATIRAEIRYLEGRFGLSPMARRRLGWEVGPEGGAEVRSLPQRSDVYRMYAVDPTKKNR